ncbi:hypothetical protein D3C84_1080110 [compost metagenome]
MPQQGTAFLLQLLQLHFMLTQLVFALFRLLLAVVFEGGTCMSILVFEGQDLGGTLFQQPI